MPVSRARKSKIAVAWPLLVCSASLLDISTAAAQAVGGGQQVGQAGVPQQGVSIPTLQTGVQRRVDVSLNAAVGYDSNATRSNKLRPPSPTQSKQDFDFPLAANVDIQLPAGRNVFSLAGFAGYDFNVRNSNLNSENIGLNGSYQRTFFPCAVTLNGGYRRGRTQFGNTSFVQIIRNLETTSSIGGDLSCGEPVGFRPFGSVRYTVARNSQLNRKFNDHDLLSYGAGVVYTQPSIGDIGLVASVDDTLYPNRANNGLTGARRVKARSVGVYFNRATARILQARVQVNYTSVDVSGSTGGSFNGLSGNANIRFMPGSRFAFNFAGGRAVVSSLAFNSNYNIDTSAGVTVSAPVSNRLSLQAGYTWNHRKYVGQPIQTAHPLTADTRHLANFSGNYALHPKIGLQASVSYEQRRANDPFFNFSAVRGTIGVSVRL